MIIDFIFFKSVEKFINIKLIWADSLHCVMFSQQANSTKHIFGIM